jgi:hypothetical protein
MGLAVARNDGSHEYTNEGSFGFWVLYFGFGVENRLLYSVQRREMMPRNDVKRLSQKGSLFKLAAFSF